MTKQTRRRGWLLVAVALVASAVAVGGGSPAMADSEMILAAFDDTATGVLPDGGKPWQPFISYGDPNTSGSVVMKAQLDFAGCASGVAPELAGDLSVFNGLATDGVDQPLFLGLLVPEGTGSMHTTTESQLLGGLTYAAPGVGSPDFSGYVVTRIVVVCSQFSGAGAGAFETLTNFVVFGVPTAAGIIDQVESFDLPAGLENALKVKLEKVLQAIEDGDVATACTELSAFVNQVEAQAGKKLTADEAQQLLDAAGLLAEQLDCP